jgi:hypothetical protein
MNGLVQEAPSENAGKLLSAMNFPKVPTFCPPTPPLLGKLFNCKEVAMIRESFVIDTKTLYRHDFAQLASWRRTSALQSVCQSNRIGY